MPHEDVKKAIDDLKVELEQTPKETGMLEGILERAKDGIERFSPEAITDLVETLRRESREFEVEHPRVTAMINQVANTLSGMGI